MNIRRITETQGAVLVFFLFLLVVFPLPATAQKDKDIPTPKGLFAFGWGANFLDTKSMHLPYISGMTAYFGWSDLEPQEGKYDFSSVDTLVNLAKSKGKIINLFINPGNHSPDWLYVKGAQSITWKYDFYEDQWEGQGKSQVWKSPLPWDPILINSWKSFITKVSERYGEDTNVGYIVLTGPAVLGVTTSILLKEDSQWNELVAKGYTYEKVALVWKDLIEHYRSAFPHKRLVLGIAPNRRGTDDTSLATELVQHVINRQYTNISFMCVFLNDTWFFRGKAAKNVRDLLLKAKSAGFTIGYQMAQSANRNAKWKKNDPIVKDLRATLSTGISDGASWIEIWHDDIIDPKHRAEGSPNLRYVDDLKWASQTMMSR